ncbi:unnamed protein product, partial [Allacma fusca]
MPPIILVFTIFVAQVIATQSIFNHEGIKPQWAVETDEDIISPRNIYHLNSTVPIVKCPAGTFRGSLKYTRGGKRYFEFQSIPYAEPPKRFEPAVLKAPIEGEHDATPVPPVCPQIPLDQTEFTGQEDCLYLSVSKPDESHCRREMSNGKLLPVIFWIHPGSFEHENGFGYKKPVITHIDDEQFLFPKYKLWLSGTEQYEFSKDMVELWTNFMRSGKPYGRATEKIPWEMTNFREPN